MAQAHLPPLQEDKMLLTNQKVQMEITFGIDAMYDFKFNVAEGQFRWMKGYYPKHPLPYFLLGLNEWWKIMPNVEDDSHDDLFHAYMDSSVYFAEEIYKKYPEHAEASFFLAGALAFKARLYGERHEWSKATFAARKSLEYFDVTKKKAVELGAEMYFGDGLYNYFVEWIKENYKVLRPVLWFFEEGDKQLGLEQLEMAGEEAFYTRIEAMYYLMRIHANGDGRVSRAFQLSEYLYKNYPNNAYFHRYYTRMLYSTGRHRQLVPVAKSLLERVETGATGYEEISGRYASYYLGSYYMDRKGDVKTGETYFKKTVGFAEAIEDYDSGYYLHALRKLGQIAQREGEMEVAYEYYDKLKDHSERKSTLHKEAKEFLKEYKRWKKKNK
ncbi:hypothetical protein GCM10023331_20170 [Algivirga pacifica]|uniref:Tol-pal system protein YbgF n=2 Tax=Algivirga pacifica TaxID=1162670 RepID=A0ABP9DA52_9BACT